MKSLVLLSFLGRLALFIPLLLDFLLRDLYILYSNGLICQSILLDARIGLLVKFFVIAADCLILFAFVGVEDILRKVAVVGNPSDFVAVDVFAYQLFSVFDCSLLPGVYRTRWSPGYAFPQSNVHVF